MRQLPEKDFFLAAMKVVLVSSTFCERRTHSHHASVATSRVSYIAVQSRRQSGRLTLLEFRRHRFKPGNLPIADDVEDAIGECKAYQHRSGLPEDAGKHCSGDGRDPKIFGHAVIGAASAGALSALDDVVMNQLMQVHVVRLPRREAALEFAAVDRKKGLEHRVDQEQQRKPWRNLGVARHQQDGESGQQEAGQVGSAIPQKYLAAGPVPDQEA